MRHPTTPVQSSKIWRQFIFGESAPREVKTQLFIFEESKYRIFRKYIFLRKITKIPGLWDKNFINLRHFFCLPLFFLRDFRELIIIFVSKFILQPRIIITFFLKKLVSFLKISRARKISVHYFCSNFVMR